MISLTNHRLPKLQKQPKVFHQQRKSVRTIQHGRKSSAGSNTKMELERWNATFVPAIPWSRAASHETKTPLSTDQTTSKNRHCIGTRSVMTMSLLKPLRRDERKWKLQKVRPWSRLQTLHQERIKMDRLWPRGHHSESMPAFHCSQTQNKAELIWGQCLRGYRVCVCVCVCDLMSSQVNFYFEDSWNIEIIS